MEIAATPRRQFIDVYGEALGGRAQASRDPRAGAADRGRRPSSPRCACCSRCSTCRSCSARRRRSIKDVPDARTLFQAAGGFCDCEHCGSVYSPAAYFVDLLRYLNVSSPERLEQLEQAAARTSADGPRPASASSVSYQPLDVLLGRRPDLARSAADVREHADRAAVHRSRQRAARGDDHRRQRGVRHRQDAGRRAARGAAEPLARGLPAAAAGGASADASVPSAARARARLSRLISASRASS